MGMNKPANYSGKQNPVWLAQLQQGNMYEQKKVIVYEILAA